MNTETLDLGDLVVEVIFKDIKNVHLSVHPPTGRIRLAAPAWMSMDTLRLYAIAKLDWIKKQQTKLRAQARETPREYLDRESHYVWGRRYLLQIHEEDRPPTVELHPQHLHLTVRPDTPTDKREAILAAWYRAQLHAALPPLLAKWEPALGVHPTRLLFRHMKTKWGSCNPTTGTLLLNTELAKKPPECLEYVLVHELVHLLERHHNARFQALMDQFLPHWKLSREELNRMPLGAEKWEY